MAISNTFTPSAGLININSPAFKPLTGPTPGNVQPQSGFNNQTSTPAFGANTFSPRNAYGTPTISTPATSTVPNSTSFPIKGLVTAPSTALKSHSVTDPTGATITQTFHAPENSSGVDIGGSDPARNPQITNTIGTTDGTSNGGTNGLVTPPAPTTTPAPTVQTPPQPTVAQSLIAEYKKENQGLTNSLQSNFQNENLDADAMSAKEAQIKAVQGQQLANTGALLNSPSVAPQLGQYGQTFYNPGEAGSGGTITSGSEIDNALNQYAQMAAGGQISSIPSSITSNPILNAELNKRAKAINSNYNPITSAAQGSSSADLTGQASQLQAQANGAENNFNLLSNIAKQGGVLDNNVPILNTIQQNVSKGLASNEAVVNFRSILQSVRDQYASILGGGTVTDAGRAEALQLIPDDVSLAALQSVGVNLKSDATNRIAGIQNQVKSLSTSGAGTSGGTITTAVGEINPNF